MPGGDPWLLQETLNLKCEKLFSQERVFNESMLGFYGELAKIDAYLMENIQVSCTMFLVFFFSPGSADRAKELFRLEGSHVQCRYHSAPTKWKKQ